MHVDRLNIPIGKSCRRCCSDSSIECRSVNLTELCAPFVSLPLNVPPPDTCEKCYDTRGMSVAGSPARCACRGSAPSEHHHQSRPTRRRGDIPPLASGASPCALAPSPPSPDSPDHHGQPQRLCHSPTLHGTFSFELSFRGFGDGGRGHSSLRRREFDIVLCRGLPAEGEALDAADGLLPFSRSLSGRYGVSPQCAETSPALMRLCHVRS